MFFNKSRLERLEREVVILEDLFAQSLQRIDKLEQARWGLKVDGTPKSKPGRKSKEAKDVRIS